MYFLPTLAIAAQNLLDLKARDKFAKFLISDLILFIPVKEMKVLKGRKAEQEKLEDIKVMNYLKEKAVCDFLHVNYLQPWLANSANDLFFFFFIF